MTHPPLSILVVEDEALVAMELQAIIEDAGHVTAGWVTSLAEANRLVDALAQMPDLAFVDVHLADGSSGIAVAERLRRHAVEVVFTTANAKRLAQDLHGAIGIMAKPYSSGTLLAALAYLHDGMRDPPPGSNLPAGLRLSPRYERDWIST